MADDSSDTVVSPPGGANGVDTSVVKLCPDTGEMLNGGIDPIEFIRDFLPGIAHVHITDFNLGEFNDGYCPVGTGLVDVEGVVEVLEAADHEFMIMAELNPNGADLGRPATPLELARTSRDAFARLGHSF